MRAVSGYETVAEGEGVQVLIDVVRKAGTWSERRMGLVSSIRSCQVARTIVRTVEVLGSVFVDRFHTKAGEKAL